MTTDTKVIVLPTPEDKYVLLQGIKHGNRFFTSYKTGDDPTKSAKGETWYIILGYAATIEEAQVKLYGKSFIRKERKMPSISVVHPLVR